MKSVLLFLGLLGCSLAQNLGKEKVSSPNTNMLPNGLNTLSNVLNQIPISSQNLTLFSQLQCTGDLTA